MLTFDELPTQPVDGLTFAGVTFGFTENGIASNDAQYDTAGPNPAMFLSTPVLAGPLSPSLVVQLLMTFESPVATLDFGLALDTVDSESPGAILTVFDSLGNVLNTYDINTGVLVSGGFSEALFSYGDPSIPGSLTGPAIGKAALTFPSTVPADLFAVDNLTFAGVPEPGSWTVVLLGIGGIAAFVRKTSRSM